VNNNQVYQEGVIGRAFLPQAYPSPSPAEMKTASLTHPLSSLPHCEQKGVE
jgi:hypothetical protein